MPINRVQGLIGVRFQVSGVDDGGQKTEIR